MHVLAVGSPGKQQQNYNIRLDDALSAPDSAIIPNRSNRRLARLLSKQ